MCDRNALLILAGAARGLLVHWCHKVAAYFTAPTCDHCVREDGRLSKKCLSVIACLEVPGISRLDVWNSIGLVIAAFGHWTYGLLATNRSVSAKVADRQHRRADRIFSEETDLDELDPANYVPRRA